MTSGMSSSKTGPRRLSDRVGRRKQRQGYDKSCNYPHRLPLRTGKETALECASNKIRRRVAQRPRCLGDFINCSRVNHKYGRLELISYQTLPNMRREGIVYTVV